MNNVLEALDLLKRFKQIILYGPPGTGKTKIARDLAQKIISECINDNSIECWASMNKTNNCAKLDDFIKEFRNFLNGEKGINIMITDEGYDKNLWDKSQENTSYTKFLIYFLDENKRLTEDQKDSEINKIDSENRLTVFIKVKENSNNNKEIENIEHIYLGFIDIDNIHSGNSSNDKRIYFNFYLCYNIDKKDKIFVEMCNRAKANSSCCYVLIIDEINRANLPEVMGELLYALEYRNKEIKLLSGNTLVVPDNLYIIGTMNTADKSAGRIDYAIRRRFAFYPFHADSGQVSDNKWKTLMERINNIIEEKISPDV